jgi:hypothetical protein
MNLADFLPVFLAVAALLGVAVGAMAIGVMFRRPCLRGSCGGPEAVGPDGEPLSCASCPNRKDKAPAT